MQIRTGKLIGAACIALGLIASSSAFAQKADTDGLVKVKSAYSVEETVERIKRDIASKGIMYFMTVDQSGLAKTAGVDLRPSMLLIFGNPPLGTQFLTSNAFSGLDWPVRLLVLQDDNGEVWTAYNDFSWIARRHGIMDRDDQFGTASGVIDSITSSVRAK